MPGAAALLRPGAIYFFATESPFDSLQPAEPSRKEI